MCCLSARSGAGGGGAAAHWPRDTPSSLARTSTAMVASSALFTSSDVPLALVCCALGAHCEAGRLDVLSVRSNRLAFFSTLFSTVLLVPALAVALLKFVPDVPAEGVLGVLVTALTPGGPLANFAAAFTGANSELNVLLTTTEMSLCVALVPFGLLWVLPRAFDVSQVVDVPYAEMLHGIVVVLGPMMAGVGIGSVVVDGAAGWCPSDADATARRRRRRWLFRVLLLSAMLIAVALRRLNAGSEEAQSIFAQLPAAVRLGSLPPPPTLIAALAFGALTVTWSVAMGLVVPEQPRPNRISMCLEVGIRDLTVGLGIALLGLPSLSELQRAQVAATILIVWVICNGGVVVLSAALFLLWRCQDSNKSWPESEGCAARAGGTTRVCGTRTVVVLF